MAKENSFDITCETNVEEVDNAVNQAVKEMTQRYDFKGSKSEITLDKGKNQITLLADSEGRLRNVIDILQSKLIKRNVSIKALVYGAVEKASGDMVRQVIDLQQGIPIEKAKEIVKVIKNLKMKAQASIQGDQVRVTAKKIDDLQEIMAVIKENDFGIDMKFSNYR